MGCTCFFDKNFFEKRLTTAPRCGNIALLRQQTPNAGVAQLVEQLICNQQVGGSSPSTGSTKQLNMGEFPSGQRGQTVNLLRFASMVQIHSLPPKNEHPCGALFFGVTGVLADHCQSGAKCFAPQEERRARMLKNAQGYGRFGTMDAIAFPQDDRNNPAGLGFKTASRQSRAKAEVCKADPRRSRGDFAKAS